MFKVFLVSVLCALQAQAFEGKVLAVKGDVKLHGSQVSSKVLIPEDAYVTLGEKSYLKLQLMPSGSIVSFGSNTTVSLKALNGGIETVNITKGIARWVSGKLLKKGSGIATPQTVMGVRGTDFFVNVNPLLGESEIICFDGEVDFTNYSNKTDTKLIKKNQWGGLGGRFGAKIGPVLDLPANVITHFKNLLE